MRLTRTRLCILCALLSALATWLVRTGLVNSAGRYGRFVRDVAYMMEEDDGS